MAGTPASWPAIPDTPAERQFSGAMLDYWTSFARNAKPTSANGPDWNAFGSTSAFLQFADGPSAATGFMPGMYALHEEVMCRRRADGSQSWNWRAGSTAPVLPMPIPQCAVRP
jgi:para-nitrobenzyl esterase